VLAIGAPAGRTPLRFAGRLSHGRTLGAGSYVLTVVAVNAAGTVPDPHALHFMIVP
jgi:hypothetical protein